MQLVAVLSSVTPGTIYPVQTGGCAQIAVDNDSPYDVWVSFGPQQPLLAPAANMTSLYNGVARSMATTYLPVPDQAPAFNGVCFLGVYDPAGLALEGTASSRAQVYVSALQAGETPGAVFAVPRLADTTNQPRNISLPMGLSQWITGQIALGTTTHQYALGARYTITAAQRAANTCCLYFYYGLFTVYQVAAAATADVLLQAQFYDNTNTPTGAAFTFARFSMWNTSGGESAIVQICPAFPLVYLAASIPAAAISIGPALLLQGASGNVSINFTVATNLDLANTTPIYTIGMGQLYTNQRASF